MKVENDKVVGVAYVLTVDGQEVDTASASDPMLYMHGAGNIITGLEEALEGKQKGDSIEVTISPEDGYGERDEDATEVLSREDFDDEIEIGAVYYAEDPEGAVSPFVVIAVQDNDVTVDFNHPLAGKTLHFQATVLDVRDATSEELEHGHPHGADGTASHN